MAAYRFLMEPSKFDVDRDPGDERPAVKAAQEIVTRLNHEDDARTELNKVFDYEAECAKAVAEGRASIYPRGSYIVGIRVPGIGGGPTHAQARAHFQGLGGAPTRATTLPTNGADRKKFPVGTGVLDYFPDALVAIASVSWAGNEQHNPGQPLHWDRAKSQDEADTMIRHYLQRGTRDTDGQRHTAKMAWRALAILQKEIESENSETR